MVNKLDFIKIEYTGYDKNGNIFDSSQGEIAKQLHSKEGAMLIVFGVDRIVNGLEEAIGTMKIGEEIEILIPPEKAFGIKNKEFMEIIPITEFHKNGVNPVIGTIIELNTGTGKCKGLIKSVNSGRVFVDFNHPLAGQTVKYKLKLIDIVQNTKEKINELMKDLSMEGSLAIKEENALITIKKGQHELELKKKRLMLAIKDMIPEIKEVEFKEE